MNKEDKRLTINDLTIDDYLKDFKRAIDGNDWYEIEGKFLKPLYEQIIKLQQENKQLKDNWNKLKKYILNHYIVGHTIQNASMDSILEKMKELEVK